VQTGKDTCPTIVFIHGSPGSWDAFEKYLLDKDLCKKFRLISIDRPGFGYSDFGSSLDLSEQSMIISPLFQLIQNQKPIYLVGHSLGGPMIVQLSADNPNTFKGLVIISGAIDVSLEPAEKWRPLFMNNPLKFLLPGAFKPSNEELWYLKKDLILMKPMFAKINCPVHILHGNKDQFVDYGNLAFGAKAFVNAPSIDTITFQGANHFIPWTKFEEIKKVLMKLY
jgi:pimeloyl-ACP methyl ester carboxylesterase